MRCSRAAGWSILILDLAGYRAVEDLGASVIVEPACGTGAFLVPIVERLAESCARHGRSLADSGQAIRAFDVLARNVDTARESVATRLVELGQAADIAESLSSQWIAQGDFLLGAGSDGSLQADFVVGNPPYVRLEDVPAEVSAAYRSECSTMRGRGRHLCRLLREGPVDARHQKEGLRSSVQTAGCTTSTANGFALWSVPNTRWTPSWRCTT